MKQHSIFQLVFISAMAFFLTIPSLSFAGEKVDFSGKWTLNESKSDLGEGRFRAAAKMTVMQDGDALTVERTRTGRDGQERTASETFTMDGKESINEGENRKSTSTVTWSDDGSTMTIKSIREFSRQGETFEMNSTEVWTLAEDGKILKIQSDTSSARGERSVTLFYE